MLEFYDTEERFIDGVDLFFPNYTISGPIFNKIFIDGLSFKAFEEEYNRISLKKERISNPDFQEFKKYVLVRDIWGSAIELLIGIRHQKFDAVTTVACRDGEEFIRMNSFCERHPKFVLRYVEPLLNTYEYRIERKGFNDRRKILLTTSKQSTQQCSVALFLNF